MSLTVAEIAGRIGGTLEGPGAAVVTGVASLHDARTDQISFLSQPKYARDMAGTHAAAVILRPDWQGDTAAGALIRVANPDAAFAQVTLLLANPPIVAAPGIHPTAVIAPTARLGKDVSIGPYCVIEAGAQVGDRTVLVAHVYIGQSALVGEDCRFYPFVSLREYVRVGDRVILHNGAVVGSDGFGYSKQGAVWKKIPQLGIVVLGDDVELGANTTVDRARFGETRIERGVKIDNLVMIAHNVVVGPDTAMASQVGISGSTRIGARCMLGGKAGFAGHIVIGDDVTVCAASGVDNDIKSGAIVLGVPAIPHRDAARRYAAVARLPQLRERVSELEARLKALEETRKP